MNMKQIQALLCGITRRFCHALTLAGGLTILCVLPAQAAVTTGDQFTSLYTETNGSDPGLTGTATITIGSPASPGFFNISGFSVTVGTDICFSCGLLTENLSGVLFDATTLDLKGNITGTFLGSGGNLHTFDLALTDPAATWTFTNVRMFDGRTDISSGTYSPAVSAVPEPSSWVMLSLGLLALAYRKAQQNRSNTMFLFFRAT